MAKKVFLKECYIQGTNQYDALEMTRGRILYYWTVAIKNKLK